MSKENNAFKTLYCEHYENRNKMKFIVKIIEEINQSLNKILDDLTVETKELMRDINTNATELKRIISLEPYTDQTLIYTTQKGREILERLRGELEELNPQLKQLPYSNNLIINNLCKAINTVLAKLAAFLLNGPHVGEGVYIPAKNVKTYSYNIFHPCKRINTSIEEALENLNSPSVAA